MQVFKAYFKIIKKHFAQISIIIVVFLLLAVLLSSNMNSQTKSINFTDTKPKLALINRDTDSELIKGLTGYLKNVGNLIAIEDNIEKLQDALFYREVEYIAIIPKGFTESFANGGNPQILKTTIPDSGSSVFTDMLINKYLDTARLYLKYSDKMSQEEIYTAISNDLYKKTPVEMQNYGKETKEIDSKVYYYNYFAYALFAVLILAVSNIMIVFNQIDLRRRNTCAPINALKFNIQLILGNLVFAMGCWSFFVAFSFILYGGDMLNKNGIYHIANSLIFAFTALSISFLVGLLIKSQGAISAVSNVLTLGLCFISGVFAPQEFLGESVLNIASFAPTYWFVKVNNTIGTMVNFNMENLRPIFEGMLIQAAFGIAFLAVSLVISKQKRLSAQ